MGFFSRHVTVRRAISRTWLAVGRLWEGARLVKGLVVLSLIVEIGLAHLPLVMEMAGLGGSGARADVGSLHPYMASGLMLCDT